SVTKQLDEIQQRVNDGASRTLELERLESARCEYAGLRTVRLNWQADRLEAQLPDRAEGEASDALLATFQRLDRARELAVETKVPGDSARLLELCQQGEHQLRGAQIMHLSFLASDAARPDVIETPEEWRQIVAATPISAQLASAERDWAAGQADRAIGNYERARQSWSRVQVIVLERRLEQTRQLFSARHYLDDAEYGALVQELDAVSRKMPTGAEPLDARIEMLTQARVDLVQAQVAALKAAGTRMQNEYAAQARNRIVPGGASDDEVEVWSNTIPGLLQELNAMREASAHSILRYVGSGDRDAAAAELAAAEASATNGLQKYEQLWKLLKQSVRMSLSDVKQLLESIVPRGVRVSAKTDPATSGPDVSSSRPPERGLFAPAASVAPAQLPPANWYRLVQLGDWLTLVVALVVAALVGLLGVWGANPTFSHFDYATAFLWGFGSHEGVKGITLLGEQFGVFPKQQG
ncbi:MAG: hypothetical protein J5I93_12030, partial [Pirellulaceae bacterium]|nr:hypothetical protein [Pirellulaceae bacterium]